MIQYLYGIARSDVSVDRTIGMTAKVVTAFFNFTRQSMCSGSGFLVWSSSTDKVTSNST